jgi:hypothetical protein
MGLKTMLEDVSDSADESGTEMYAGLEVMGG